MEPDIRALVAEHLGLGLEVLVPDVLLQDDLAADSLDLVELSLALEAEFAIVVPDDIFDRVRTYSDLVHATGLLIRARGKGRAPCPEPAARMWVGVTPPVGEPGGTLPHGVQVTVRRNDRPAESSNGPPDEAEARG